MRINKGDYSFKKIKKFKKFKIESKSEIGSKSEKQSCSGYQISTNTNTNLTDETCSHVHNCCPANSEQWKDGSGGGGIINTVHPITNTVHPITNTVNPIITIHAGGGGVNGTGDNSNFSDIYVSNQITIYDTSDFSNNLIIKPSFGTYLNDLSTNEVDVVDEIINDKDHCGAYNAGVQSSASHFKLQNNSLFFTHSLLQDIHDNPTFHSQPTEFQQGLYINPGEKNTVSIDGTLNIYQSANVFLNDNSGGIYTNGSIYTNKLTVGSNKIIINANNLSKNYKFGNDWSNDHVSMIQFQYNSGDFYNLECDFENEILLFKRRKSEKKSSYYDIRCKSLETTSDIKYKYDIQPILNSKQIINKLNPVYWKWKDNHKTSCGLIAQDVKKIVPSSVKGDSDLALNYTYFIGLLISRVQEMEREIQDLRNS